MTPLRQLNPVAKTEMTDKTIIETYTEIIIEKKSGFVLVECRHCRGTGQKYPKYGKNSRDSDRAKQCPTCGGYAVLALAAPRIECRHCSGTGQKYPKYGKKSRDSDRAKKCPTCKGTGSNPLENTS